MPDWSLDIPLTPQIAMSRLERAIASRPRRAFGVIKVKSEFVGVVAGHEFEVWERRQRAVHAVGRTTGGERGSRVEVRLVIPPRTRALIALFFALYALAAAGIASQDPDPTITLRELAIALAGAAALAGVFYAGRRRQRKELIDFLSTVLTASSSA